MLSIAPYGDQILWRSPLAAAGDLTQQSDRLRTEVETFLATVRAA
jgi:hypothetical protein